MSDMIRRDIDVLQRRRVRGAHRGSGTGRAAHRSRRLLGIIQPPGSRHQDGNAFGEPGAQPGHRPAARDTDGAAHADPDAHATPARPSALPVAPPDAGSKPQTTVQPKTSSRAFKNAVHDIWLAVTTGDPKYALPAFFPEKAYEQVKAIDNPDSDWENRLWLDFTLDLAAVHKLVKPGARLTEVDVAPQYFQWIPPGACYIKGDSPIRGFCDFKDVGWGGGPASDGKTLFARPTGSRGQFSGERSHLSGDGGAVWGERGHGREVVAALAGHRQRGCQADGRMAAAAAKRRARMAVGADWRETGPDLAGGGGRAGRTRHASESRGGVALFQT